ncbi:MAG: hypothetical protein GEU96_02880 [Propionibacteriales bacterium]|nr:hypothetical protein [Propionibacteriales bacterium]
MATRGRLLAVGVLPLVLLLVLVSCGVVSEAVSGPSDEPGDAPPAVTVRSGDSSVDLPARTYCYRSSCVDGVPPETLPVIAASDTLEVGFPLDNWTFEATFVPAGKQCGGREETVELERTGDTTLVLEPPGEPATYDVTLSGRGDGDLFVDFRWTTTAAGGHAAPTATLAVLADNDGDVDSYGVEMAVTHLAEEPARATAQVTVTATNGRSLTFEPAPMKDRCTPAGTIVWRGPGAAGQSAKELGPAPFTYQVELVLDGVRHVAKAKWPADQIVGNEPSVALTFMPALPIRRR